MLDALHQLSPLLTFQRVSAQWKLTFSWSSFFWCQSHGPEWPPKDMKHMPKTKKKCLLFFILSLKHLSVMFVIYCGLWMCRRPHLSTTGKWFHSLCPTMVHQIPHTLCCMCQILGFEWRAPCVEGVVDGTKLNNASWGILPKWFYAG